MVRFSLLKPVVIIVGVLLILIFGFLALDRLPQQLTPNVIQPQISVYTTWNGASPKEIEREIIERNLDFLEKELGVKLIIDETKVPEEKRRGAMPGKPAIYVV